jgi:hypothetical protein
MRKLTMLVAVMVVMLAMAGALAFSPKVAEAQLPTWCYQQTSGDPICISPMLGEKPRETSLRCEITRVRDPLAASPRCVPQPAL